MKGLVAWFASNGVVANLLMVVILVGGALSLPEIRKEVFPEFSTDLISVSVVYPGAAPEEVEEGICIRIEESVQSLAGVKRITSTASEGMGIVNVEILEGTDARELLDDVKGRVDAISTFPEEAEQPVIQEFIVRNQVINIAVSGPADERTLKRVAEQVRDEVVSLPGITQAELSSARPYEVSIEVSEDALLRHGLSFDQVALAVPAILPRPARGLGEDRGRRDPAENQEPGLRGGGIPAVGSALETGRHAGPSGRCRPGRGRIRRDRSGGPVRR